MSKIEEIATGPKSAATKKSKVAKKSRFVEGLKTSSSVELVAKKHFLEFLEATTKRKTLLKTLAAELPDEFYRNAAKELEGLCERRRDDEEEEECCEDDTGLCEYHVLFHRTCDMSTCRRAKPHLLTINMDCEPHDQQCFSEEDCNDLPVLRDNIERSKKVIVGRAFLEFCHGL